MYDKHWHKIHTPKWSGEEPRIRGKLEMIMNGRFFGWLAAAAVALNLGGALSASAQTHDGEENKSVNAQESKQNTGEQNLLAMASVPPTATNAPAPAPPSGGSGFHWTGFYVGGHFGRDSGHANMKVDPLPSAAQFVNLSTQSLHTDPAGKIGGLQGGFNLQRGPVVYGIESDYSFSDMKGTKVISPIVQNNGTPFPGTGVGTANSTISHQDTDWLGTLRLRLGATPVPRLLVYGTGGIAAVHSTLTETNVYSPAFVAAGTDFSSVSGPYVGWVAGGGLEWMITNNWLLRGEYLYYSLNSSPSVVAGSGNYPGFPSGYSWSNTNVSVARAALSYKF